MFKEYYSSQPIGDEKVYLVVKSFQYSGLVFPDIRGRMSPLLPSGCVIPESTFPPAIFDGCLKGARIVFGGNYVSGGMHERPLEIKWRKEITDASDSELVRLTDPKWENFLYNLAVKDASNSHNKQGVEK